MADEKLTCRWCGTALRKSGGQLRHAKSDNGRCETLRRRITGDANTPIEAV